MQTTIKYPILMVHGMGFRDYKHFCYWGRIPDMLIEMGCKVYFGHQDCNADIETNGHVIAERIDRILQETGAEKINIIAHSKGGLDTRYAISALGRGDKVASLTTISTPHNGSRTMDVIFKIPNFLIKIGCFLADIWFKTLGDNKPDTYSAIHSLRTNEAERFNERIKNDERVYYQSYAFVMKKPTSDFLFMISNLIVKHIEGENDGLLTPEAVKWGDFKGVYRGVGTRGISHSDEVDMYRRPLSRKSGDGVSDILNLYRDIVKGLSERGL